jgi:Fic family protein
MPFDTPLLMTKFIEWFNAERHMTRLHPLLLVGIWVMVFLKIHPFQNGNGWLSRILTTLLLLQAGYGNRNTFKQHFSVLVEQDHLSQRSAGRGV